MDAIGGSIQWLKSSEFKKRPGREAIPSLGRSIFLTPRLRFLRRSRHEEMQGGDGSQRGLGGGS